MNRSLKHALFTLTAYLLLTIVLTWPALRYFTTGIPGDGFDGWQNYWNLWWVKQALLVDGTWPFFTAYLDAPTGVSLLFHTLNIFNGLWTLPLQLNFGLALAYNSIVLLSFGLAGYGGYLLSLYTLSKIQPPGRGLTGAAFIGGLIFTMAPFHMAHLLGHMQVFSMIWPPFYVLWLLRTLDPWAEPGSPPPPRQRRDIALSALFLGLATLVDWYHTLYLLMFTAVTLLWVLWRNRRLATGGGAHRTANPFFRPIAATAAIGLLFGVALSPLLLPMVRDAGHRPDLETGLFQNITLSADALAFVLPSEMHPLWGQWAKSVAANFTSTTSERLVFAGFTSLLLAGFTLWRGWRHRPVKFWAMILAGFVVMALGPYLHINGQMVSIGGWDVPLPYLALYYTVPFLNLTRSLSRYDLMVMLSLGVLAAVALARIQAALSHRQQSLVRWPAIIAGALVCLEFLAAPYPVSMIDTPRFYTDLAAEPGDFTIAELPLNWDRPTPLLHQTAHGKRLLTAYTSRENPRELTRRTPVFQQWRYLGPDIIDQPLAVIAPTIFYDFNLRYIVLDYWQMPPGPEREQTERWVAAALPPGTAPIYDDGRLKVYASPPRETVQPYLSLGHGWGPRVETDGAVSRVIAGTEAELFIHHPPAGQPLTLELSVAAQPPQTLTLWLDAEAIATVELNSTTGAFKIALPTGAESLRKLRLAPAAGGEINVSRVSLGR